MYICIYIYSICMCIYIYIWNIHVYMTNFLPITTITSFWFPRWHRTHPWMWTWLGIPEASGRFSQRKTMGKPWEHHKNHNFYWKTIGKLWENGGQASGKPLHNWWENHRAMNGKSHYFDWAIFNSSVKIPEGISGPFSIATLSAQLVWVVYQPAKYCHDFYPLYPHTIHDKTFFLL